MNKSTARIVFVQLLTLATSVGAQQRYDPVDPPVPVSSDSKLQVLEFFWYGCPHCNAFHPHIEAWERRKPDHVEFKLVAAPLNPSWTVHSRAYYAAEVLGKVK